MALLLTTIITFSVAVKAFTSLFTLGYLPSPVLANLLPHEGAIPSIEDDFGVVLLKLGTACIEATQYSGLRNEVASITESRGPWVQLTTGDSDIHKRMITGGFATEITDIKVAAINDPARGTRYRNELKLFWQTVFDVSVKLGWNAVVATPGALQAISTAKKLWSRRWWYGPRRWKFWRRQAWDAPVHLQRLSRPGSSARAHSSGTSVVRASGTNRLEIPHAARARSSRSPTPADFPYDRYLLGEVEMEDDDEDWDEEDDALSEGSDTSSFDEDENSQAEDVQKLQDEQDMRIVLAAHLSSSSSSPLTRRRYAALAIPAQSSSVVSVIQSSSLGDIVADRRMLMQGKDKDEWDEDRKRSCVVCTVEQRDTVLWPCRCLALCNECRESLAARLPAHDHMCP